MSKRDTFPQTVLVRAFNEGTDSEFMSVYDDMIEAVSDNTEPGETVDVAEYRLVVVKKLRTAVQVVSPRPGPKRRTPRRS